jgi:hypothetical protein
MPSRLHGWNIRKIRLPCTPHKLGFRHVHALIRFGRGIDLSTLLKEVKQGSSKWIKGPDTGGPAFRGFHWQKGYGAFSIGQSQVDDVLGYIRKQQEHHQKVTFQDEYRKFLKAYEN